MCCTVLYVVTAYFTVFRMFLKIIMYEESIFFYFKSFVNVKGIHAVCTCYHNNITQLFIFINKIRSSPKFQK